MKKIGVLGGTFDPVHIGHLISSEETLEIFKLDHVLFIPSKSPPHKKQTDVLSFKHRANMVEAAIENNERLRIERCESRRPGYSYSIDTIHYLMKTNPEAEFYFILGIDAFAEINTWKDWEQLLKTCHFIVTSRPNRYIKDLKNLPGHFTQKLNFSLDEQNMKPLDTNTLLSKECRHPTRIWFFRISSIEVSSSGIRKRISENRCFRYLVPEKTYTYIKEHGLYS